MLTLLALMVVLLPFVDLPPWMRSSGQLLGVAALVAAGLIVLLSFWKERLLALAHTILRPIRFLDRPGVYAAIGHLIDGFATLRGRLGLALIGISFLAWLAVVVEAWTAAVAVRLDAPITAITLPWSSRRWAWSCRRRPVTSASSTIWLRWRSHRSACQRDGASFALVWHAANYLTLSGSGVIALWAHGIARPGVGAGATATCRRRAPEGNHGIR